MITAVIAVGILLAVALSYAAGWMDGAQHERTRARVQALAKSGPPMTTAEVEREVREWNEHAIKIMVLGDHLTPEVADRVRWELARMGRLIR
jgi:hypothetical protein